MAEASNPIAEASNQSLGPQPNFNRISELHQSLADEMKKIPNAPQFDTAGLTQTLTRIETKIARIETKVDGLVKDVANLNTQQRVNDHNQVARTHNSLLSSPNDNLAIFLDPITNNPIPGFPTKSQDIGNMRTPVLDTVLQGLGLGIDGSKLVKQQRLRLHIGLKAHQSA